MTVKTAILIVLAMTGCAGPWPQAGRGGMAERLPIEDAALARAAGNLANLSATGAAPGPGRIAMAQERLLRARREHEGGLYQDADTSLAAVSELAPARGGYNDFPFRPVCAIRPCP